MAYIKIGGLQKTTTIDYPGMLACTVFTKGCNFRCPYCHNKDLMTGENQSKGLDLHDLMAFLKKRQGLLDGVCISGGEPLLQVGIEGLIEEVKAMGYQVKLDTNGAYPKRLKYLLEEGLVDYVAMDLKHSPQNYGRAIANDLVPLDQIKASVESLMKGHVPYEFRTTLVKGLHTLKDMEGMGQWIQGANNYYLQNYRQVKGQVATKTEEGLSLSSFTEQALNEFLEVARKYVTKVQLRSL